MEELIHALGIDWKLIIAQMINFALLLFILTRFVLRPVLRLLDERAEGVKLALRNEEKATEKLASADSDREKILAEARTESSRMIETARNDGEEVKKKLIAGAKEEIAAMHVEAQKKLKDEHRRLLSEVKAEVGSLVIATIEHSLGDVLDDRTQGKMVEQALSAIRGGTVKVK